VELSQIVDRFIEGISYIDRNDGQLRQNQRTKAVYLPGLPMIPEADLTYLFARWWRERYPKDFDPSNSLETEVAYPYSLRNSCDLVFSTTGEVSPSEWAVEVKKPALIGDNGKNNDYSVSKLLSPFLKDRSLSHDVNRLAREPIARRRAVLGMMFRYSFETCDQATQNHPEHERRIAEIRNVCRLNDAERGVLDPTDLIVAADLLLQRQGQVRALILRPFVGLWRHPCGGDGIVFAWEVNPEA
jgi:hypothetical protein